MYDGYLGRISDSTTNYISVGDTASGPRNVTVTTFFSRPEAGRLLCFLLVHSFVQHMDVCLDEMPRFGQPIRHMSRFTHSKLSLKYQAPYDNTRTTETAVPVLQILEIELNGGFSSGHEHSLSKKVNLAFLH